MLLYANPLPLLLGGLPRSLWILAGAAFVNFTGRMALPFMALYLTQVQGFGVAFAGWLLAAAGVGNVVGSWTGGWLSDRVAPRAVLVASFVATGLLFLAFPFASGPVAVALLLFATATAGAAFRPAYNACVIRICPDEERGRAYAVYLVASNTGGGIGGLAGGLAFAADPRFVFWIDAATSFAAALVVLAFLPDVGRAAASGLAEKGEAARAWWRDGIFLGICAAVLVVELATMQQYAALSIDLTERRGHSADAYGTLIAAGYAVFAGLALPLTAWAKGRDRRLMAGCGALGSGLSLAALAWAPGLAGVTAAFLMLMVSQLLFFPAVVGMVMARAGEGAGGRTMGAYHAVQALGAILAPVIGTAIYGRFGGEALWLACGIAGVGASLFFVSWRALRPQDRV